MNNPITEITTETIQSLNLERNNEFNYRPAQLTKDLYYSPFVWYVLQIYSWGTPCIYFALEMIYCMVFTPSPMGWCTGIEWSIDDDNSNELMDENIIIMFITCMRDAFGSVSWGSKRRRQVSHQAKATKINLFRSLHNLLAIVRLANESNDTEHIISVMIRSPSAGGLFLVGPLMSQELINVLTKVGIITNQVHAEHVVVSVGTRTNSRLASLGISTEQQRNDLIDYLTTELQMTRAQVENAVCEALRMRFAPGRTAWDTIGGDHLIYTLDNGSQAGRLRAFTVEGTEVPVVVPQWNTDMGGGDFAGVRWWDDDWESTFADDVAGDIKLTLKE